MNPDLNAWRGRRAPIVAACGLIAAIASLLAFAGTANAQATCFGQAVTIVATPGRVTWGTPGPDVILGTGGNDDIRSRGGRDLICGGGGNDRVHSGHGGDYVDLGVGDDWARGGPGNDTMYGSDGNDRLRGRRGADTIDGGPGEDNCKGGGGRDSVSSCSEPSLSSASGSLSRPETQMVSLVNDLRSNRGLRRLSVSAPMSNVARSWSSQLTSSFRHNPNVGSQIPGGWWAWGENIAYNASVRAAFDALVDSPGHYRNMVDSGYTHIGVGVHVEGSRVYVTQVFASY